MFIPRLQCRHKQFNVCKCYIDPLFDTYPAITGTLIGKCYILSVTVVVAHSWSFCITICGVQDGPEAVRKSTCKGEKFQASRFHKRGTWQRILNKKFLFHGPVSLLIYASCFILHAFPVYNRDGDYNNFVSNHSCLMIT